MENFKVIAKLTADYHQAKVVEYATGEILVLVTGYSGEWNLQVSSLEEVKSELNRIDQKYHGDLEAGSK